MPKVYKQHQKKKAEMTCVCYTRLLLPIHYSKVFLNSRHFFMQHSSFHHHHQQAVNLEEKMNLFFNLFSLQALKGKRREQKISF